MRRISIEEIEFATEYLKAKLAAGEKLKDVEVIPLDLTERTNPDETESETDSNQRERAKVKENPSRAN